MQYGLVSLLHLRTGKIVHRDNRAGIFASSFCRCLLIEGSDEIPAAIQFLDEQSVVLYLFNCWL
jgi:hypothetical protein